MSARHNQLIVAPYSTLIQREIYTEDFNSIIGHLPFLKNRLESDIPSKFIQKIVNKVCKHLCPYRRITASHPSQTHKTFQVQSVASRARQSDTKTIKRSIIMLIPQKYLPLDRNGNAPVNAYQVIGVKNPDASKSWRGWGNLITARLLCPIDHLAEFETDRER